MKKVRIIAVGKIKEDYLKQGIAEYLKRLASFALVTVIEIADSPLEGHEETESAAIESKLAGYTVLLDLEGKQIDSVELSQYLEKPYLTNDTVSFIIGGSNGVTQRLKSKVNASIGLGKVTYPHQLMRLILLEQIYRGFNILSGTPYHK